jgi:hypothetical protein
MYLSPLVGRNRISCLERFKVNGVGLEERTVVMTITGEMTTTPQQRKMFPRPNKAKTTTVPGQDVEDNEDGRQ